MASKKTFNFKLNDPVRLKESGETGVVISRSHSIECDPQYSVRYKAADGRQTECWWSENALEANPAST